MHHFVDTCAPNYRQRLAVFNRIIWSLQDFTEIFFILLNKDLNEISWVKDGKKLPHMLRFEISYVFFF